LEHIAKAVSDYQVTGPHTGQRFKSDEISKWRRSSDYGVR